MDSGQHASPRLLDSHHNTSNHDVPRRTPSAIIYAAVACALISPIALLPYFATKRHITALQQSIKVLKKQTRLLRDELDLTTSMQRSMTSELCDLRAKAHNTSKLSNEMRKKFNHRETERLASHEAIQTNLRELLEDSQHSRTALREVGMSLADVARFMQTVELQFGIGSGQGKKNEYGIERLRLLAFQMQNLPRKGDAT